MLHELHGALRFELTEIVDDDRKATYFDITRHHGARLELAGRIEASTDAMSRTPCVYSVPKLVGR